VTRPIRPRGWLPAAGLVLGLAAAAARAEPAGGPVVVTLRATATTGGPQVTVGDVAALSGGDPDLRRRIERLDLADLPREGQTAHVSREQVGFRIRLADIDARQFRVEGAARSAVTVARATVSAGEVVAAARALLMKRLPWPPEDLTVELAQPVHGPIEVRGGRDRVRLEPVVPSSGTLLGLVRVDVSLVANGERQRVVPAYFEVKLHQSVAVATRRIAPGEPLGEHNVQFQRLAFDGLSGYLTMADGLANRRARRLLAAGQVVTTADTELLVEADPVLIKSRDYVKLVTHLGPLTITALGEALQEGRRGEVIRVRNVDSNRVVRGKVAAPSLVEVEY